MALAQFLWHAGPGGLTDPLGCDGEGDVAVRLRPFVPLPGEQEWVGGGHRRPSGLLATPAVGSGFRCPGSQSEPARAVPLLGFPQDVLPRVFKSETAEEEEETSVLFPDFEEDGRESLAQMASEWGATPGSGRPLIGGYCSSRSSSCRRGRHWRAEQGGQPAPPGSSRKTQGVRLPSGPVWLASAPDSGACRQFAGSGVSGARRAQAARPVGGAPGAARRPAVPGLPGSGPPPAASAWGQALWRPALSPGSSRASGPGPRPGPALPAPAPRSACTLVGFRLISRKESPRLQHGRSGKELGDEPAFSPPANGF